MSLDKPPGKKRPIKPNQEIKGIIDGFEEDVSRITQEFSTKCPDMRLTDFFLYWSDKKLDLLFVNRFDPRELLEAISEMNKLLVTLLENQDQSTIIVSLYMLLCIYVKQPQRQKRCIRLTIDELINIEKSLADKPGDASFAWKCLRNSNAIYLAEEKAEYGPQLLKKGGNKLHSSSDVTKKPMHVLMKDTKTMIEKQNVLLNDLMDNYYKYVQILKSLDIKHSTKFEEITKTMDQLKDLVAQR